MAVAARVVSDLLVPALRALQDVPTQSGGAAGGQVVENAALLGPQARTVLIQECITTAPDDLGHFEPRSGHGWSSSPQDRLKSSDRLPVAPTAALAPRP